MDMAVGCSIGLLDKEMVLVGDNITQFVVICAKCFSKKVTIWGDNMGGGYLECRECGNLDWGDGYEEKGDDK